MILVWWALAMASSEEASELQVRVRFEVDAEVASLPEAGLDGRLLLLVSDDEGSEPRFQISDGPDSQLVFGTDVQKWKPGETRVVGDTADGWPLSAVSRIPAGDYFVQGLLHRYETFRRSDGHVVKLPMDQGEGQQWNRSPGNLLSSPRRMRLEAGQPVDIVLDQVIPPIQPPKDTKYIKHVRMQSRMLTEFWGRPMHLGACVLLPEGFDEHPDARYPLVVNHGHFPATFSGFREEPPDPDLEPAYSSRFDLPGYNRVQQELAHQLYQDWVSPDFPRMVIIKVQHANPYYDDSYAVNSQNLGPYGDAIMFELLPFIEQRFRCIGEGWARFTYGGSTGGWEALAVQVLYPDHFNGCFAACPDPVDFRAYTVVNLYEDTNAYRLEGRWHDILRPAKRDHWGHVSSTLLGQARFELALGRKSRSGQQWDIWEAVYSPVASDGYPKPIWDKETGVIDPQVAAHWREHYDLSHILQRDWATLAPKLQGKLHVYCGTMDNYYLNNAVELLEQFLENTDPYYGGLVDYGVGAEHCWNGDHERSNAYSRLRYHQMYVPLMLERMEQASPPDADLTSWRY